MSTEKTIDDLIMQTKKNIIENAHELATETVLRISYIDDYGIIRYKNHDLLDSMRDCS